MRLFIILFILGLTFHCDLLHAQVKIGDNPDGIDATSLLELESTTKVLVITRMTTGEIESLTPLAGAIVYNTDEECIFYYNGVEWSSLCGTETGGGGNGIVETITSMTPNDDGTFTYTNEAGEETLIAFENSGGEDSEETITTMVRNEDGTYTYVNENGDETILSFGNSSEPGGNPNLKGEPGSVFFAGGNGNVNENNTGLHFNEDNGRFGVGTSEPNATVSIQGSISTDIQFLSGDTVALTDINHTVIVTTNSTLFLPAATPSKGMMFIVKRSPEVENSGLYPSVTVPGGYFDSDSIWQLSIPEEDHVVWFQSNGFLWEQVN